MCKIKFNKMNKSLGIYDGKRFVGIINLNEFLEYINNNSLDIKEFDKL